MTARTYWRVKPIAELTSALEAARAPADLAQHALYDQHLAEAHFHLAVARMIATPTQAPAPVAPVDLLLPPREILAGRVSETWRAGAAADRRERALRKVSRYVTRTTRGAGGMTLAPSTVELTYPASVKAPPIEGVS